MGRGISAGLMAVLAEAAVEIYDVEQIVVRGRLILNVLTGAPERATIRDLVLWLGARPERRVREGGRHPTPTRPMSVVTVIGMGVGPEDLGPVAGAIDAGVQIDRIYHYPVTL